jgi:hypothetical protein
MGRHTLCERRRQGERAEGRWLQPFLKLITASGAAVVSDATSVLL